jgi:hypothetical protein
MRWAQLVGASAQTLCYECGTSLYSAHTELCEFCCQNFWPGCLSFHQRKHPRPAMGEHSGPRRAHSSWFLSILCTATALQPENAFRAVILEMALILVCVGVDNRPRSPDSVNISSLLSSTLDPKKQNGPADPRSQVQGRV